MKRLFCLIALFLFASDWNAVRAANRPNVLFLLSDDQRFDTIHALGNAEIQTPTLDRLVRDGFAFTQAYCMGGMQGAICVPSRAMILSGRSLFHVPEDLPPEIPLWPEVMAKSGYATFGAGKWHNGTPSFARCFQSGGPVFFGGMSDHLKVPIHDFDPTGKYDKKSIRIAKKYSSELFADAAIDFLRNRKKDKPFFAYIAFTAPHDPRMPPKDIAARYDPAKLSLPKNFRPLHPFNNGELKSRDEELAPWPRTPEVVKKHIADYYGMITHLDAQVGRILKALEDSGQAKNTIVVFTSDHGLALGRHGLFGKQNLYEHSMRPPLLFAGPSIPKGKTSDALCYLFDILPTVCDWTHVAMPKGVDGKSLAPIVAGKATKVRDTVFLAYRDVQRSIRDARWKLIRYPHINKSQLFDLRSDLDELHDLAADRKQAEQLKRMTTLLVAAQKQADDKQPLSTDKPAPLQIALVEGPAFADKELEAAVRAVLREPKVTLTEDKLKNVYVLEVDGKKIRTLAGLEKCNNLAQLKLSHNEISDLKPLKDLGNLQSLDLSNNKIVDVTPLGGLLKLQYLELSNNQIVKVDGLKTLTALSSLYLSGNKIEDIKPLAGLTRLSSLYLGHNQIQDISALAKVTRLMTLELQENQIADLKPLTKQTDLNLLLLEKNKVSDLSPLVDWAKADAEGQKRFAPFLRLYLAGNPLSEEAKSKQIEALKKYGVRIEEGK